MYVHISYEKSFNKSRWGDSKAFKRGILQALGRVVEGVRIQGLRVGVEGLGFRRSRGLGFRI